MKSFNNSKITKHLLVAFVFVLLLIVGNRTSFAKVEDYTYSVAPMLAPFNEYVYVKTNNPDPNSFRIVDKSSKYVTSSTYQSDNLKGAIFSNEKNEYKDVLYENISTLRVKDGYIFRDHRWDEGYSDGGELVVEKRISTYDPSVDERGEPSGSFSSFSPSSAGEWKDTGIRVTSSKMLDYTDYVVNNYTNSNNDLFTNLDNLQAKLNELSVYPHSFIDTSKKTGFPYLATSPYPELSLNKHIEDVYNRVSRPSLLYRIHPFILDSLSFPGTISSVAKRLDPNVEITAHEYHWLINITKDGVTKAYGGAGTGEEATIPVTNLTKLYTFNGSTSDYFTKPILKTMTAELLKQKTNAGDVEAPLYNELSGKKVLDTIGSGSWIKVAVEGWGGGQTFSYIFPNSTGDDYNVASDTFVDGRYLNKHETIQLGETFDKHPKANIILRNVNYLDINGLSHTSDINYTYEESLDLWHAYPYYTRNNYTVVSEIKSLPKQFKLTREEIKNLNVDSKNNVLPVKGFIYDGDVAPGTPYSYKNVTGISLPADFSMEELSKKQIKATILPSDALSKEVTWTSSDESILTIEPKYDDSTIANIEALKTGTVTVTAKTIDGAYVAKVNIKINSIPNIYYYLKGTSNVRDLNNTIIGSKQKGQSVLGKLSGSYVHFTEDGKTKRIHISCLSTTPVKANVYMTSSVNIRKVSDNSIVTKFKIGDYVYGYQKGDFIHFNYKGVEVKAYMAFTIFDSPRIRYINNTVNLRDQDLNLLGQHYKGETIYSVKIGNYYRYYDNGVKLVYKTYVSDQAISGGFYTIASVNVRDTMWFYYNGENVIRTKAEKGSYFYGYIDGDYAYTTYDEFNVKIHKSYVIFRQPKEMTVIAPANVRDSSNNIVGSKSPGATIKAVRIGDYYRFYEKGVKFIYHSLVK